MNKTTYIPGPWTIGKSYTEGRIAIREFYEEDPEREGDCIAEVLVRDGPYAALIAAAPNLLRAALTLLANAEFADGHGVILTQDAEELENVIKQATGGI